MRSRIRQKWRPRLSLVIVAILTLIGALPIASLAFLRIYETQLVRAAEGELIAQSAVLAAAYAQAVERYPDRTALLGPTVPTPDAPGETAIEPTLDLAADPILPERPDPVPAAKPMRPAALIIGLELAPLLSRTKAVTLAGFRVLDRDGTVIAGGLDLGRSLADLAEVESARSGRFRAVMRTRTRNDPAPPLYSISRGTGIRVFTAMPVVVDGRLAGVIYGSRTPSNLVRQMYAESGKILAALGLLIGAIGVIAFVFARLFVSPIHGLVARAAALGRGETAPGSVRTHYGTQEIALLAHSVDEMARRLRERSDYIATFAAHVSHELKSPLTAIQGGAELMRDALDEPGDAMPADAQRRFLDAIIAQASRLSIMLGRLREMARADNPRTDGITDVGTIVAALRASHREVGIVLTGASEARLAMSAENAGIVFGHLADNAARHGATELQIAVRAEPEGVEIRVANNGAPIPAAQRGQIFDDFFTTRRETGGTGMGLSIVRAMLAAHRATIALNEGEEAGFILRFETPPRGRTQVHR